MMLGTVESEGGVISWSQGANANPKKMSGKRLTSIERMIGNTLRGFLSGHPCIGARTLSSDPSFHYAVYQDMESLNSSYCFLRDLDKYFEITDPNDKIMKSLVCVFLNPVTSQEEFSRLFWAFAQNAHDLDCLNHPYASGVSSDPASLNFELSFRSRAVFPTTIHPAHSRTARRFSYPGWAHNQVSQFDELREQSKFSDWQRKIRAADSSLDPSGQPNPLLADTGTSSAAPQIAVLESGEYPFKARKEEDIPYLVDNLISRSIEENAGAELREFLVEMRQKTS